LPICELASVDVRTSETDLVSRLSSGLFELIYPEEECRIPDTEIIFAVGHDVPLNK
jgi:hypothetical protein